MKFYFLIISLFLTFYVSSQCACVWIDVSGNVQCELYPNCSGGPSGSLTICANKVTGGSMHPCEIWPGMNWNCGGALSNGACFYNGNSCDADMVCTYVFLPIELLNFNARFNNTYNEINWTTATENNNDYFIIEHSINGIDWKIINKTTGAGNSTQLIDYQYNDYKYLDTINYYRLKQVDYNGDFKLYDPVAVDNTVKDKSIIKITNTLGQDVSIDTPGIVILLYSDGTIKRTWNQ